MKHEGNRVTLTCAETDEVRRRAARKGTAFLTEAAAYVHDDRKRERLRAEWADRLFWRQIVAEQIP